MSRITVAVLHRTESKSLQLLTSGNSIKHGLSLRPVLMWPEHETDVGTINQKGTEFVMNRMGLMAHGKMSFNLLHKA